MCATHFGPCGAGVTREIVAPMPCGVKSKRQRDGGLVCFTGAQEPSRLFVPVGFPKLSEIQFWIVSRLTGLPRIFSCFNVARD